MTNEEKLIWIAKNDSDWRVRQEALKYITDKTVLADIENDFINKYYKEYPSKDYY